MRSEVCVRIIMKQVVTSLSCCPWNALKLKPKHVFRFCFIIHNPLTLTCKSEHIFKSFITGFWMNVLPPFGPAVLIYNSYLVAVHWYLLWSVFRLCIAKRFDAFCFKSTISSRFSGNDTFVTTLRSILRRTSNFSPRRLRGFPEFPAGAATVIPSQLIPSRQIHFTGSQTGSAWEPRRLWNTARLTGGMRVARRYSINGLNLHETCMTSLLQQSGHEWKTGLWTHGGCIVHGENQSSTKSVCVSSRWSGTKQEREQAPCLSACVLKAGLHGSFMHGPRLPSVNIQ